MTRGQGKLFVFLKFNRESYKPKAQEYLGMSSKPLIPYNPTAKRNQMQIASLAIPYKNSS